MRKDSKIALCVTLTLMVLAVIIWGHTMPEEALAPVSPKPAAADVASDKAPSALDLGHLIITMFALCRWLAALAKQAVDR